VFIRVYNLKRNLTLFVVFLVFFFLLIFVPRCLVFWGFLIYTLILIYVTISLNSGANRLKKTRYYWYALTIYSSIVFVVNIAFIFTCLPYMQNKAFIQEWKRAIPDWLSTYPQILGFVNLETQKEHPFTAFLPVLTFLILSVYVAG